jgi:iron complex transport system substrate-binding protein
MHKREAAKMRKAHVKIRYRLIGMLAAGWLIAVSGWGCAPPAAPQVAPMAPQRIASLTLATDEILAELVPCERLVCVTYLADDPEISNVAGFYPRYLPRLRDRDVEQLLGLAPDLICVASYNSADFLNVLERAGLPIYRNESYHSLDQIEQGILRLGERVGARQAAQELAERLRQRRQYLRQRLRSITHRPRVLFWSAGFTSGEQTTLDDLIREAGGINIAAAELKRRGPVALTPEEALLADPDYLLVPQWSADQREGPVEQHPLLRHLRAVQEQRVVRIAGRYLLAVSHHALEGAERLARRLHPECFPEVRSLPTGGEPSQEPSP